MKKHISYIILAGAILLSLSFGFQVNAQSLPTITMDKPVKDMSISELQAKIAEILSVIQQMQALIAQLQPEGVGVSCNFYRNLYPGTSGSDVKCLQQYLNNAGHTLASSGLGSPNNETIYYGSLTRAAVKKWQDANNIEQGAWWGYFGPKSRAKYNELAGIPGEQSPYVPPGDGTSEGKTYCGDSIAQRPSDQLIIEDCDGADIRNKTCISQGFTGGTLSCSSDCSFNISQCLGTGPDGGITPTPPTPGPSTSCGDNIIQSPNTSGVNEVCDATSLNNQTCITKGYTGGTLSCSSDCLTFNTTNCTSPTPPVNNAPVLNTIGNKSIDENNALIFQVSAIDPDEDDLSYSVSNRPEGAVFTDQTLSWTPSYIQSGTYNVTFIVSDSEYTDQETITITVLDTAPASFCGDGSCDAGEICSTCSQDCGNCPVGNTYYLDAVNGDDVNHGTSELPWKTIGRAKITYNGPETPKVVAGDTIILRSGNYGKFWINQRTDDGQVDISNRLPAYTGSMEELLPEGTLWTTYKADAGHTVVLESIKLGDVHGPYLAAYIFDGLIVNRSGLGAGDVVRFYRAVGLKIFNSTLIGNFEYEGSSVPAVIYTGGSQDIQIINNSLSKNRYGFYPGGNNIEFIGNKITDIGEDPMRIGGKNILVEDNELFSFGPNIPATAHQDFIHFTDMENATFRNNRIYAHAGGSHFNGAGHTFKNFVFEGNIIYDMNGYELRPRGIINGVFRNNTIIGIGPMPGFNIQDSLNVDVYNNLFLTIYGGDESSLDYHDYNVHVRILDYPPGANEPHSYGYSAIGPTKYGIIQELIDETLSNYPQYCRIIIYNERYFEGLVLGEDAKGYVTISKAGETFTEFNLRKHFDYIEFVKVPGLSCNSWSDPCRIRFKKIESGLLTIYQKYGDFVLSPGVFNGILKFSGSNKSKIYIADTFGHSIVDTYHVGDIIDYNYKEEPREIIAVGSDEYGDYIQFTPDLSENAEADRWFCNWGQGATNLKRDFRPKMSGPACPGGNENLSTGEYIGALPCVEAPASQLVCGNNIIEIGEQCDGTDLGGQTCQTQGYNSGTLSCSSDCQSFDTSSCVVGVCTPSQTQSCNTGLSGACSPGTQVCQADNTWGSCIQIAQPSIEVCTDNLDNDCDGTTDCSDTDCFTDPACLTTMPTDYISYWKFEGNADDETGTNNGTIYGNPQYVTGVQGQGLSFDGDGDYVGLSGPSVGSNPFTSSFWFRTSILNYTGALGFDNSDTDLTVHISRYGIGGMTVRRENDYSTLITTVGVNDGQWHFFAFTRNSSDNLNIYLDGQWNNSSAGFFSGLTISDFAVIGRQSKVGTWWWNGEIDEMMIFDRALSAQEIQDIYDSQKPAGHGAKIEPSENEFFLKNLASILSSIRSAVQEILEKIKNLF